jgi:hypothetical protein
MVASVPRSLQVQKTFKIRNWTDLSSDGSGNLYQQLTSQQYLSFADLITSSPSWTDVGGLYDEYRCRSVRLSFHPYGVSTTTVGWKFPAIILYDADTSAYTAANPSAAIQYIASKVVQLGDSWEVVFQTALPARGQWYDIAASGTTGTGAQQGCISMDNFTTTIQNARLGALIWECEVDVRGQRS